MLTRILEPEIMASADDAREYDAMDHTAVNAQFVGDLLRTVMDLSRPPLARFLDLGVGTAQIPIELAHRYPAAHVTGIDAAQRMLALADKNITATGLSDRIDLVLADAKHLPFADNSFPIVISNSILHHIAEPRAVVAEAVRVISAGGLLFHRDLARPNSEEQLHLLVDTYAGTATPYQRRLFGESLRAALTLEEMQDLVATFGFNRETVQMTSDRHWAWVATA